MIKDGTESLTHIDLPTYLYDETLPYRVSDTGYGLLRGHCLLRVSAPIFLSQSRHVY